MAAQPKTTQPRGIIDPQVLIAASDRLRALIEKENEARALRMEQMEKARQSLNTAADQLVEAATNSPTFQEKQWCASGCPTANDVKAMKPLKIRQPSA